ncbi:MAG: 2-amino-4-hydroxy-6-hydroxymethyldihydropteridine diphosphokinase [Candidatus Eremiobacteraeota bacterium]|nr:2-amino-4-hydroxy-6-hydroxymethyldihydropteridine diphosphokinase [Candidatus Eremiobacteraeota bacterium]
MSRSYIGIGSNLGDPIANVRDAIAALGELGTVERTSSLYRTKPWGKTDQPEFLNAVALIETGLTPRALLAAIKALEDRLGRVPTERWGPRAIDLDILTYDDLKIEGEGLTIPHAGMLERAFVLVPLAEIDEKFGEACDGLSADDRAACVMLRMR